MRESSTDSELTGTRLESGLGGGRGAVARPVFVFSQDRPGLGRNQRVACCQTRSAMTFGVEEEDWGRHWVWGASSILT